METVKTDQKNDQKTEQKEQKRSNNSAPSRRHTVTCRVSSDNIEGLRSSLEAIGFHVQADRQKGVHDGYSSTFEWEYVEDPDMDHQRYFDLVADWQSRVENQHPLAIDKTQTLIPPAPEQAGQQAGQQERKSK